MSKKVCKVPARPRHEVKWVPLCCTDAGALLWWHHSLPRSWLVGQVGSVCWYLGSKASTSKKHPPHMTLHQRVLGLNQMIKCRTALKILREVWLFHKSSHAQVKTIGPQILTANIQHNFPDGACSCYGTPTVITWIWIIWLHMIFPQLSSLKTLIWVLWSFRILAF